MTHTKVPNAKKDAPVFIVPKSAVAKNAEPYNPSSDEVAVRAYHRYLNDGAAPDKEVEHWLAAEAELIATHQSASA